MNGRHPDWGGGSRFYLPNEDASVVCAAIKSLRFRVRRPVFVGGSGMTLLEAAATLPRLENVVFVDVADFQFEYFRLLLRAVTGSSSPEMLRAWFGRAIYPALRRHHLARGRDYALDQIFAALRDTFGVRFFFDAPTFDRVQRTVRCIAAVRTDIGSYLARERIAHDFIYLSNVPDYLGEAALERLFAACQVHSAPVYLLLTSACPDPDTVKRTWETAGYAPHPASTRLNAANRGLGSPCLERPWNRPGTIHLLLPAS
ncbi:MAG: hypothetical protein AAGU21_11565 [Solidesulfovibrio sp.]|uniref:hypothetical protein n=1 Tax=Solidesulfovibrio sp. TaxID=2910990 RepID=UPI002B1F6413|nr:hypothetical protein [Solidesulfovibrio sp.]MEA4857129.1 hypothetical protein [Solidesulfovibrio sp.]